MLSYIVKKWVKKWKGAIGWGYSVFGNSGSKGRDITIKIRLTFRFMTLLSCTFLLLISSCGGDSGTDPTQPGVSGTKVAFVSERDGNLEIYVMNADGSNQTRLTNNPADDWKPSWSPDGSKIIFMSARDGKREIYVMNSDGSNPVNLTNNTEDDWVPIWSPDGTKIAFASEHVGNLKIYVMNADGTNPIRLTDNPANHGFFPSWSPDGTRIAFTSSRDGNDEIYVMNADGSNQTRLTNSPVFDFEPSWSPSL